MDRADFFLGSFGAIHQNLEAVINLISLKYLDCIYDFSHSETLCLLQNYVLLLKLCLLLNLYHGI